MYTADISVYSMVIIYNNNVTAAPGVQTLIFWVSEMQISLFFCIVCSI